MKNVVITILVVLVLGLGGYLVYDKVNNKQVEKDINEAGQEVSQENKNDKETVYHNDINENQKLKYYFYATKQEDSSHSAYRYSITLGESDENRGFFTIDLLNELEHVSGSGHFNIDGDKLVLSVGPFAGDNDFSQINYIFDGLGVSLKSGNDNYKTYTLNYNKDQLQIGNLKFYNLK